MNQRDYSLDANRLHEVLSKGQGLTRADRGKLVKTWIDYKCRHMNKHQRNQWLHAVAGALSIDLPKPAEPTQDEYVVLASNDQQHSIEVTGSASSSVLNRLLVRYYGSPLPDQQAPELFKQMISELGSALRTLCYVEKDNKLPWRKMIDQGIKSIKQIDENMKKAADQSFDQLLRAVSPTIAKQHKEKKKWQTEASYKAELFDKISEKYEHLQAYHNKGRLVRDFRSLYKLFYKKSLSE